MEQTPKREGLETRAEALGRLRRIAKLAPRDPELQVDLARALLENLLTDEAIDQLRLVISMSPNHLEARKVLEFALDIPVLRPS